MSLEPGWYTDHSGTGGRLRWWDGTAWSDQYWSPPASDPVQSPAPIIEYAPPRRQDKSLWFGIIVGVIVLAVMLFNTHQQAQERDRRATTFPELGQTGAGISIGQSDLDTAENLVMSMEPTRGADGSFAESAEMMARAFGAEIQWTDYETHTACTNGTHDPEEVAGFFCSLEPTLIHINMSNDIFPEYSYEPEFIDVVKHELSHLIIMNRCGTTSPPVDGAHIEGVTESYAQIYLGAAPASRESMEAYPDYATSQVTEDKAHAIHSGNC